MSTPLKSNQVNIDGIPLLLSTSEARRLTGLTNEYLRKLGTAGLLKPFQKAKASYKYWRRDELLKALGFEPVTTIPCPTSTPQPV
jgi:hypothetical protein